MEHFTCLCAVLFEFVTDISIPNSAELMGIYGRVRKSILNFFNNHTIHFLFLNYLLDVRKRIHDFGP